MPYYPTLAEDLRRAKEILERGKVHPSDIPEAMRDVMHVPGGAIFGVDNYAAYKLLESLVEVIEVIGPKVCELALRHQQMADAAVIAQADEWEPPVHVAPSITCPKCGMTSYNLNDVREGYCGNCRDWTRKDANG